MDERLRAAALAVEEDHWWYRGRRRIIAAEIDRLALPPGARILDAGCGSGRMLAELARYGSVAGVELDSEAVAIARARDHFDVRAARVEELPFADATFDLITCLDVIEHTPDDRLTLAELRRVCRPGGWLLVRATSFNSLLLAPAAAVRLGQRWLLAPSRRAQGTDPELGPSWLGGLLERLLAAEAAWLRRGRSLPFGLSLLAVLRRPAP